MSGEASDFDADKALRAGFARLHEEKRAGFARLLTAVLLAPFIIFDGPLALSRWFVALFATLMLWFCGGGHIRRAAADLRNLKLGSDFLISLALVSAFGWSLQAQFTWEWLPRALRRVFWNEFAVLTVLTAFGRYLAVRLRWYSAESFGIMAWIAPKYARVVRGDREVQVLLDEVFPGDRLRVHPGEQIPVDGKVVSGHSALDESLLTGQSAPSEKGPGSRVLTGAINKTAPLEILAVRTGPDRTLVSIVERVREAAARRPRPTETLEIWVSAFAPWLLFFVLLSGAFWFSWGPEPRWLHALFTALSMFVAACPMFAAAAVPIAITAGQLRGEDLSIRLRDTDAVERYGDVDSILLDKSGTVTRGVPTVREIVLADGVEEQRLLSEAVLAESRSEHPYALALREFASEKGILPASPDEAEVAPGKGVRAVLEDRTVLAGNIPWLAEHSIEIPEEARGFRGLPGRSMLAVASGGRFLGAIHLADPLRSGVDGRVRDLKQEGLRPLLVSGDRAPVVEWAAAKAGIEDYYSEILPDQREIVVQEVQKRGRRVLAVGESLKVAPALARADLSFAVGHRGDIVAEAADVALRSPDIGTVVQAVRLLGRIQNVLRGNLIAVFGLQILLLFIAAGGLYPLLGWRLEPRMVLAFGGIGGLFVMLNSLRLWRIR